MRAFLANPLELATHFSDLKIQQVRVLVSAAQHRSDLISDSSSSDTHRLIRELVSSVSIGDVGVLVVLDITKLKEELLGFDLSTAGEVERTTTLICPLHVRRRGVEVRIVLEDGREEAKPIPSLIKAVARGKDWADRIASGKFQTMAQLVEYSGLTKQYVRRILRCAALSPRIRKHSGWSPYCRTHCGKTSGRFANRME